MAVRVFVSLLLLVPVSGHRAPQSTVEVESSFEKKFINSTEFGIIGHHGSVLAAQPKVQETSGSAVVKAEAVEAEAAANSMELDGAAATKEVQGQIKALREKIKGFKAIDESLQPLSERMKSLEEELANYEPPSATPQVKEAKQHAAASDKSEDPKKLSEPTAKASPGRYGEQFPGKATLDYNKACWEKEKDWLSELQRNQVEQIHFLLGEQMKAAYLTEGPTIVTWRDNMRPHAPNLGASDLKCMIAALREQYESNNQQGKFPCCMTVEVKASSDDLVEGIRKEINDAIQLTKGWPADAGIAFEFQKKKAPMSNDSQDSMSNDSQSPNEFHPLVVHTADEMWSKPRSTEEDWRVKVRTYESGGLKCGQCGP